MNLQLVFCFHGQNAVWVLKECQLEAGTKQCIGGRKFGGEDQCDPLYGCRMGMGDCRRDSTTELES